MGEKAQGREYIKEAEVAPHQEPGYKHAITPIMLKMACTIGGVHIRRFTRRAVMFFWRGIDRCFWFYLLKQQICLQAPKKLSAPFASLITPITIVISGGCQRFVCEYFI
ncbi:hypothetical protein CWB74_19420 [Pseudoalteromonas piscicida]|uniref:Uncharacterized protein n=1 Tax=Pseudoalteromonas piscicida TaxID=43662 RepID=A0AAQ2IQV8_PSEO7|nr:hypothetical protein TW75_09975 [Pseudoalteromonas piscicida]TMN86364.1 hypothetical protein CWB87_00015 [Pseudoalteromonas flavipulchra]TMN37017.1 hypothetical protein CWB95_16730 [Pseudoalteromonas piscicida]TMN53030.1 hypothetical protein CWB92_08780 [Pseudoalteromonas piscicida]TMN55502.1 hypothetical protein CWB91_06235 [Pseudoalteromonas piscicida]